MTRDELAALIADHGETYLRGVFFGCDCGLRCGATEWPHHLAGVIGDALGVAA